MKRQYIRRRPGFTLVEMMVSVALTLFILSLFAVLMRTATQGVRDAKGINAIDSKIRNAVTVIREDLKNVYLAKDGQRFYPGKLFTRMANGGGWIPDRGYFSLEGNDRALAQGVDANGNPVEVDYDNVISMTVARAGTSPSEVFYGRAADYPNAAFNVANGDLIQNAGGFLDNQWADPGSRFDVPSNSLVTSRYAEVVYFLRPVNQQPTLENLSADPNVQGGVGGVPFAITPPSQQQTFNLHRRQLLVLDDDRLNRTGSGGFGRVRLRTDRSFYNQFDVSAVRDPVADASGNFNIHFNTLADLTRREFRYGMQWVIANSPAPFNADPYPFFGTPANMLRSFPLSHLDNAANPVPKLHDYYRATATATRPVETWYGRPTLYESAHTNFPFWAALNNTTTPGAPGVDMTPDATGTSLNAYTGDVGQRRNEDVLLRDVLSMPIQVLETTEGVPGDDAATSSQSFQGAPAGGQARGHDLRPAPYSAPALMTVDPIFERRLQFVDLGGGADQANVNNPAGGAFNTATADVNVLTLPNYLVQNPPAPQNTPMYPAPAGYTYNAIGTINFANLDLTNAGGPFKYPVWNLVPVASGGRPPQTPVLPFTDVSGGTPLNVNLLRGAYSPKDAPFGVPLNLRVHPKDLSLTSDVFFGPDGKLGLAGYQDTSPGGGGATADTLFDLSTAMPPGEYLANRSDDVDFKLAVAALGPPATGMAQGYNANAADTSTYSPMFDVGRPGLLGLDARLGQRGAVDNSSAGSNFASVDAAFFTPATTPNDPVYLNELFASSTDDNPFVGVPFKSSGQVAANVAGGHPFNIGNLNPRNTYDSWSADTTPSPTFFSGTVLPPYRPSPVRSVGLYTVTPADANAPPVEPSYIPEPDFRPVPYPRPLKGIQIKLRVLERRTGIVREATIRHFFPAD